MGKGEKEGFIDNLGSVNGPDLNASKVRMEHPSYEDIKDLIDKDMRGE